MRRRTFLAQLPCFLAAAEQPVLIVAHRGAVNEAPENTIPAYARAVEHGADYIEVDVRPTADGTLVVMHDARVDRTTNGSGAVAEMTLAQIRTLDAGARWLPRFAGTRVPTFAEVLAFARERSIRVDVDHKGGTIEAIAGEIRRAGTADRVLIEGGLSNLRQFVRLLPGVATMPKVQSVSGVGEVCRLLRTNVVRLSLSQLAQPGFVAAVRGTGARVSVTILGRTDNEETMRQVIRQGARIIETDRPELLARVRKTPVAAR